MGARIQWLDRIKGVEREFYAARLASELLSERLRSDSSYLKNWKARQAANGRALGTPDAERMQRNLESTYLLRLFAVFEAGVREAWIKALGKSTNPSTYDLVQGVTSACKIDDEDLRRDVHGVREYRNSLVHGGIATPYSLSDARRVLNRFFDRLPPDW